MDINVRISEFFLTPSWAEDSEKISCGFTLPAAGNQALTRKSIFSGKTTAENRIKLAELVGADHTKIVSPRQTHSDICHEISPEKAGLGAFDTANALEGDAVFTNSEGILLLSTWADCIPVLLYEPSTKWAATIHSGWRSTHKKIVPRTVKMLERKGICGEQLFAAVGPGIRGCCYEVGAEFKEFFAEYKTCFRESERKLYFDLQEAVYLQLLGCGILPGNIDRFDRCTCCSTTPFFFSSRKDREHFEGQAAFIVVK